MRTYRVTELDTPAIGHIAPAGTVVIDPLPRPARGVRSIDRHVILNPEREASLFKDYRLLRYLTGELLDGE
jgi:hypothetical protein